MNMHDEMWNAYTRGRRGSDWWPSNLSYLGGVIEPQPDGSYLITQAAYPASHVPSFSVHQWRINERGQWVSVDHF